MLFLLCESGQGESYKDAGSVSESSRFWTVVGSVQSARFCADFAAGFDARGPRSRPIGHRRTRPDQRGRGCPGAGWPATEHGNRGATSAGRRARSRRTSRRDLNAWRLAPRVAGSPPMASRRGQCSERLMIHDVRRRRGFSGPPAGSVPHLDSTWSFVQSPPTAAAAVQLDARVRPLSVLGAVLVSAEHNIHAGGFAHLGVS